MSIGCSALVVAVLATLPSLSDQLPGVIRIGAILTGELYLCFTASTKTGSLEKTGVLHMVIGAEYNWLT